MKKSEIKKYKNESFKRIPIKTKIILKEDNILDLVEKFVKPKLQKGDILTISESPLAITQGRAVLVSELKIGLLAKILWRFVKKTKHGVGLRSPSSMQCAIDEAGGLRILFAAIIGGLGKIFGRSGDFYRIAGKQAALVDAAFTSPVPPFDKCVVKGPIHPEMEAQKICDKFGCETAVMDINDIGGCWMIGGSSKIDKDFLEEIMNDNPQGQGDELTPFCIIRKID